MNSCDLASVRSFCAFLLNDRPFAVPVEMVKEIHAVPAIRPVPGASSAVSGYVNLRGLLYLVLIPHEILSEAANPAKSGCLIVFREEAGEAFAICVDRVMGIITVERGQIDRLKPEELRTRSKVTPAFRSVMGYAKQDDVLWTLVDPRELCHACVEFRSTEPEFEP